VKTKSIEIKNTWNECAMAVLQLGGSSVCYTSDVRAQRNIVNKVAKQKPTGRLA